MNSISEIKKEFEQADAQMRSFLYEIYAEDNRAGVVSLISKYKKLDEKLEAEKRRMEDMNIYERKYSDFQYICGIDEVGRGPLAGPVVAGAVILPKNCDILYLNDSKKLSEKMRESLYDEIMEKAVATGIGIVSPARIAIYYISMIRKNCQQQREKNSMMKLWRKPLLRDWDLLDQNALMRLISYRPLMKLCEWQLEN